MPNPTIRYDLLVAKYADDIRRGHLGPGTRLPSVRHLQERHGIAMATAHRVYAELAAAGLVVGEVGRGTFVRDLSVQRPFAMNRSTNTETLVDLSFNYPTFPGQAEMLRESLRRLSVRGDLESWLYSAQPGGGPADREIAAQHLRNRGLRLPGSQVLLVNGAQHGLSVAVQALLKPGDAVAVDALTYPGFLALARATRIHVCAVPSSEDAMDPEALDRWCRRRRIKALYVMPTLHNPLGSVMTATRRSDLLRVVERHDLLVIEDGAYAFLGEPAPPSLMSMAQERTVYISSLSKSVASGLRVGFVAAPMRLVPSLEGAIRVTAWSAPSLTVALACEWIGDGTVDALEARKRADARLRQRIAGKALAGLQLSTHRSSYFLWISLPGGARSEEVTATLATRGILVGGSADFTAGNLEPQGIRVALGSLPTSQLAEALHKVYDAVSALE